MSADSHQRRGLWPARWALPLCLLLSGAAALMYEVLWVRQIALTMGQTVYALSALLTAFLGGLAAGAHFAGRWIDRRGVTMGTYVRLELAIPLFALLVPVAVDLLSPAFGLIYRWTGHSLLLFSILQFLICALVLLPSTLLMGMTLPVVVHLLATTDESIEAETGRLYAANSFGGVLGAAAAGLLLLPAIGTFRTSLVAVGLNLAAAALVALSAPPAANVTPSTAPPPTRINLHLAVIALLYGLAGFAALALQVGWARLVTLSVGSTVYGFTITLVSFIFGLASGSLLLPRWRWLRRDLIRSLFLLHASTGLLIILSLPYLGSLPRRISNLMAEDLSFTSLWMRELLLVFATIALPTLLMGGVFPLVSELIRRAGASAGRAVGATYAANTVGSILGSLLAGFVAVPFVGMRATVLGSALLLALVALGYLLSRLRAAPRSTLAMGALLVVATLVALRLAPPWDPELLTSGPFMYGPLMEKLEETDGEAKAMTRVLGRFVDYKEGATTVVSVREMGEKGGKHLFIGGVREASPKYVLHRYLGHLGLLLHGDAKRVLVVGFGVGTTTGEVLSHPVEELEVSEISAEVVDMAEKHFTGLALKTLDDPRTELSIGDGRNHLRHARRPFDVIISQPSFPWSTGAASLFTKEYFEEIERSLAKNGVAVVWFNAHSRENTKSILRAWVEVFDDARVFAPFEYGQLRFAVGFKGPGSLSRERIARAFAKPGVKARADAANIRGIDDLLRGLLQDGAQIRSTVGEVPANTDDNGYVELRSFRAMVEQRRAAVR